MFVRRRGSCARNPGFKCFRLTRGTVDALEAVGLGTAEPEVSQDSRGASGLRHAIEHVVSGFLSLTLRGPAFNAVADYFCCGLHPGPVRRPGGLHAGYYARSWRFEE